MTDDGAERTDVFVSYAGPNRDWAEWVAWQLRSEGYSVELDVWDWVAGENFVEKMAHAVERAKRVVALFSPAYFEPGRYTKVEWSAAMVLDRLIPLLIEQVTPPVLLKTLIRADLIGQLEAETRRRLLKAVGGATGPPDNAPPFPGPTATVVIAGPKPPLPSGAQNGSTYEPLAEPVPARTGRIRRRRIWLSLAAVLVAGVMTVVTLLGLPRVDKIMGPPAPSTVVPSVPVPSEVVEPTGPDATPQSVPAESGLPPAGGSGGGGQRPGPASDGTRTGVSPVGSTRGVSVGGGSGSSPPNVTPTATPAPPADTLAPPAPQGDVPADFIGTWSGTQFQSVDPPPSYSAIITINDGVRNSVIGKATYPQIQNVGACEFSLTLIDFTSTSMTIQTAVISGKCFPPEMRNMRIERGRLLYDIYYEGPKGNGTLSRA